MQPFSLLNRLIDSRRKTDLFYEKEEELHERNNEKIPYQ